MKNSIPQLRRRDFLSRLSTCTAAAFAGGMAATETLLGATRPDYKPTAGLLSNSLSQPIPFITSGERVYSGQIHTVWVGYTLNDTRVQVRLVWRYRNNRSAGEFVERDRTVCLGNAKCTGSEPGGERMSGATAFGMSNMLIERSRYFLLNSPIILPVRSDKEWIGWTLADDRKGQYAVYFSPDKSARSIITRFGCCTVYNGAGFGGIGLTYGGEMPKAGFPKCTAIKGAAAF